MTESSDGSVEEDASADGTTKPTRVLRILVTGSRTWPKPAWVMEALVDYMTEHFAEGASFVVVQGEAKGADLFAKNAAKALKEAGWPITYERHPADWQKHGRRAGFLRNQHMVDLGADVCLAFIHNASKGSTMCRDLAAGRSIPIREYWISQYPV